TSDFRDRPFDTVTAHVSLLNEIVRDEQFDSLTYLSSTRVYIHSETTTEASAVTVFPTHAEDIFNLSKLLGESICGRCGRDNVRAIRLSNVAGKNFQSNDFLFSLIREAVETGNIHLQTTPDSEKDYLHIDDATRMIVDIALRGTQPIYNLASGKNLRNEEIVEQICAVTGATVSYSADARKICFLPIDITGIHDEFHFEPKSVLELIRGLAATRLEDMGM
ncbi:MAG: NAD-dependent epimerase/dehydratase family protein, partial [Afipia sp.]|nr:NAD-dependent epimerase/dehydratase family protein [Afipia sp.]